MEKLLGTVRNIEGETVGKLPIKTKIEIWENCALPILTYETQKWAATKAIVKRLSVTEIGMERSVCEVKKIERIRNNDYDRICDDLFPKIVSELKTLNELAVVSLQYLLGSSWSNKKLY